MCLERRWADKDIRFELLRCGSLPLGMGVKIYYPIVFTHFEHIHVFLRVLFFVVVIQLGCWGDDPDWGDMA